MKGQIIKDRSAAAQKADELVRSLPEEVQIVVKVIRTTVAAKRHFIVEGPQPEYKRLEEPED